MPLVLAMSLTGGVQESGSRTLPVCWTGQVTDTEMKLGRAKQDWPWQAVLIKNKIKAPSHSPLAREARHGRNSEMWGRLRHSCQCRGFYRHRSTSSVKLYSSTHRLTTCVLYTIDTKHRTPTATYSLRRDPLQPRAGLSTVLAAGLYNNVISPDLGAWCRA